MFKLIPFLNTFVATLPPLQRSRVAIFGAFGGRLDQEAQNLNTLYDPAYREAFEQIVLLSEDCIASLLQPGTTEVRLCLPFEGPTVGLLPLGAPVESLSTRGLKWDVTDWACGFGHRLSTSNHVLAFDEWRDAHGPGWLATVSTTASPTGAARAAAAELKLAPPRFTQAEPVPTSSAASSTGVVRVTTSHPVVWTATINPACVVAAWEARQAAQKH